MRFTRSVKNNSVNMSKIIKNDDIKKNYKTNKNKNQNKNQNQNISSLSCQSSSCYKQDKKILVKKILVASGTSTHHSCKIKIFFYDILVTNSTNKKLTHLSIIDSIFGLNSSPNILDISASSSLPTVTCLSTKEQILSRNGELIDSSVSYIDSY